MVQKPINANDKRILSALRAGITKRENLVKVTKLSEMQVRRSLEKLISSNYKFVKRIRKGHFELTEGGRKKEGEEQAKSDKMLHIGEDFSGKISSYIKNKVPMGFQSLMRSILCEMHSRQSEEIFNNPAHSGGYSSVILVGDPKTMKSPIIEAICKMTGLNFEDHKFVVGATRRETIGGWENLPGKGQTFVPASWVNKKIIILEDFGDIIKRRDTREGVLILAHGDRSFRKGEQVIPQHCVPFITFNIRTKTISENIKEIETVLGTEYVKRGIVINVNSFAASLEDSPILTRKMMKSVPRLNLNAFPVRKRELTDKEFEFMYNILKKTTMPERRKLFDERSIGRRVLSRYALSENENIIDSIFQTCIDELSRLQTLNVTVEGWRSELIKDWKEARPNNLKLKKIWEEEEQRTKESKEKEAEKQKKRLEEIEKEKDRKLNEEAAFNAEYKRELDKLKKLLLDSKGIPDFINRRNSLNKEYQNFKKGNLRGKFRQLKRRVPYWEEELEPYKAKHKQDQNRIKREKEERENIIKELRNLKSDLYSLVGYDSDNTLWRKKTSELRLDIAEVIEDYKRVPLKHLRDFLAETRLKKAKFFFSKEIEELKKKLTKFGEKQEEEVTEKVEYLDKWLSWIEDTNELEAIEEAKEEDLPNIKKEVDELISFLEEKSKVKEKHGTLKELFQAYAKLTGGMAKEHNQQNERHLESLFSQIEEAKDIDALTLIRLEIEREIEKVFNRLKKKLAEKNERKNDQKLYTKIQANDTKIRLAIEIKKSKISEKLTKPLTWRDYDDAERSEKEGIKVYLNRKKFDKGTISNMFTLAKKYLRKMGFEEKWSYHQKLPFGKQLKWSISDDWYLASGKTYLLDNINLIDLKEILTGRIKEIDDERKKKLIEQWNALDKQEKSLKPPLHYLRTNRRLIRVRHYLGKKEEQWLHFEFEDGKKWNVPKGKKWTVQTKIEYGGELFPFIDEKESTIVVQTNEGRREISKDQIFCYIYEYKGPEPS